MFDSSALSGFRFRSVGVLEVMNIFDSYGVLEVMNIFDSYGVAFRSESTVVNQILVLIFYRVRCFPLRGGYAEFTHLGVRSALRRR